MYPTEMLSGLSLVETPCSAVCSTIWWTPCSAGTANISREVPVNVPQLCEPLPAWLLVERDSMKKVESP